MDKEWQEIKKCFTAMTTAPDIAPHGCSTVNELCYRAASVAKLSKRIAFIVFGEL